MLSQKENAQSKRYESDHCFDVIYQTRETVFIGMSKHRDAQRIIFDEIRGVWVADETLSRVFDISSQWKQKRKSKRKSKIVKIYAN